MHLKDDGVVARAVCVDCERCLIWDNEDWFALSLKLQSLMMCSRDGETRLREEMRAKWLADIVDK